MEPWGEVHLTINTSSWRDRMWALGCLARWAWLVLIAPDNP